MHQKHTKDGNTAANMRNILSSSKEFQSLKNIFEFCNFEDAQTYCICMYTLCVKSQFNTSIGQLCEKSILYTCCR